MRHIQVDDGLRLRFPGRSDEFDDGVEIGIASALMAVGNPFTRAVSARNLDQIRALADRMSYRLAVGPETDGAVEATFTLGRARPALRLVHARADGADTARPVPGPSRKPAVVRLAVGAP